MEKLKLNNVLPLGIILPFALILLTEYLLSYGLNFYNQKLSQQINDLESKLVRREKELITNLEANDFFYVFSKVVNILEIARQRHSLNFVIARFNQLMPKFLIIKNFEFDNDENKITIKASVKDWIDYVRFHNYLSKIQHFQIKEIQFPKFEQNEINFTMVLGLTPSFYQQ